MAINPASSVMVEDVERNDEPESFRSALAVIKDLRRELAETREATKWDREAADLIRDAARTAKNAKALLAALEAANLQTLPIHIAHLVAAWKAGT